MVLYDMVLYDNRVSGCLRAGGEPVIGPARAAVRAGQLSGVCKLLDPVPYPDPDSGAVSRRRQPVTPAPGISTIIRDYPEMAAAGGIS